MTRRWFLGLGVVAAVGAGLGYVAAAPGRRRPLITDPEEREFVYEDGWIVRR